MQRPPIQFCGFTFVGNLNTFCWGRIQGQGFANSDSLKVSGIKLAPFQSVHQFLTTNPPFYNERINHVVLFT